MTIERNWIDEKIRNYITKSGRLSYVILFKLTTLHTIRKRVSHQGNVKDHLILTVIIKVNKLLL